MDFVFLSVVIYYLLSKFVNTRTIGICCLQLVTL